jgi:Type II intron maturase/Reverse transcriptase (RNA-dependent DNA polymerase)
MRTLPSTDPMDPGYRRLRYIRYADDHLLGFTGPRAEAEQIKARLAEFLRDDLGLELNQDKTLITHARSQRARFLGYDITVQHSSTKITNGRRSVSGQIALRVPPEVARAQCARYRQHGKPWPRPRLQNLDDYDIVRIYGAEYAGVVNYYLLAQDVWRLSKLYWHAVTSMLKTLAAKHRSTVTKMAARYRAKTITSDGLRRCFEARLTREGKQDLVARFGGIALRQNRRAVVTDPGPVPVRLPPQGTSPAAPETVLRAVRQRRHGGSSPGRRPQAAGHAGTRPARVGRPHGEDAAQDACCLRAVP